MPIKKGKMSFKVDLTSELDDLGISGNKRKQAAQAAGEVALGGILEATSQEVSPVNRMRGFPALQKDYKKFKRKKGKGSKANLRLNEEMLPSMRVEADKNSFTIKITDSVEKKKAYNHNTGDTLPRRQFLPNDEEGQQLKPGIRKAYLKMLEEYKDAKK
tara:strand:- start:88 stop:564 length:477 start_codon:yes stop_codon:yes gene_type:complete